MTRGVTSRDVIVLGLVSEPGSCRAHEAERACAAIVGKWSLPNELGRVQLLPESVSDEQADELWTILEAKHLSDREPPTEEQLARFRQPASAVYRWFKARVRHSRLLGTSVTK